VTFSSQPRQPVSFPGRLCPGICCFGWRLSKLTDRAWRTPKPEKMGSSCSVTSRFPYAPSECSVVTFSSQPRQPVSFPGRLCPGICCFGWRLSKLIVGFRPQIYPNISFTLSKIDELRSAGLFSTWIEAQPITVLVVTWT